MKRYAQIINGTVSNVIESDTDPDGINGAWVACGDAGPGYTYAEGAFIEPVAPVAAPRHISVGAFFDRFSAQKYPILASADAGVKALITDCSVRKYIDLDNPALPYGLDMLVSAGYAIVPGDIIGAAIAEGERP